jgi:hypothetical protein
MCTAGIDIDSKDVSSDCESSIIDTIYTTDKIDIIYGGLNLTLGNTEAKSEDRIIKCTAIYGFDVGDDVVFKPLPEILQPDCPMTLNYLYAVMTAGGPTLKDIITTESGVLMSEFDYYYALVLFLIFGFSLVVFLVFIAILWFDGTFTFPQIFMAVVIVVAILIFIVYMYRSYSIQILENSISTALDKFYNRIIDDESIAALQKSYDKVMTQTRSQKSNCKKE